VTEQAGTPGRRRYTDEPTVAAAATFLAEAEQRWREDAARHRLTLGAVHVELSRLYTDDTIRRLVLRRALERADLPIPDDLA
jgi:hypothetical protein